MSIIFVILPISMLLSLGAVAAFAWATCARQFDDLRTPALRALHDPAGRSSQLRPTPDVRQ